MDFSTVTTSVDFHPESSKEYRPEDGKVCAAERFGLLTPYMKRLPLEDKEDVPDSDYNDEFFAALHHSEERNAHERALKFLKQVRESKGYDLDCVPPSVLFSPFQPMSPEPDGSRFYSSLYDCANFAIQAINSETSLLGKTYTFVKVERVVVTRTNLMLLTILAKEEFVGDAGTFVNKTLRAMVHISYGGSPKSMTLKEWMYKPLSDPASTGVSSTSST